MPYRPNQEITFKIERVNFEKKYLGAYKKIFDLLNRDRTFTEVYETDDSIGWVKGTYWLTISETPDWHQLEAILKIPNVSIAKENEIPKM
jgi:predicted metal-dependent phosphoesterase TrpH